MNLFAPQHLIPILIILLLLFGRGKISEFMGDFAKGIKSFKKGLKDDDDIIENESSSVAGRTIEANPQQKPVRSQSASRKPASKVSARRSTKSKS